MIAYRKLNGDSLPSNPEQKPSENNDQAFSLHRLINERKKTEILELIKNNQITPDHINEINGVSENVIDHLCRAGYRDLIITILEANLVTTQHLAGTSTRAGALSNIICTVIFDEPQDRKNLIIKMIELCLQKNLVIPATLDHKLDENAYMLMQKQGCPDELRRKFNNYCQKKFETACREGDARLAHKWLNIITPHLPLINTMEYIKLLFDFSPHYSFADMLSIVMKHIKLSDANQAVKRDEIFRFLLDRLGKENNQLKLSSMIADFFNDTEVKDLFKTTFNQGKFPSLLEQLKLRARIYVDTKPGLSNEFVTCRPLPQGTLL